ncbi:MAG TPA: hypothetical protein VMI32_17225 [Candidatus Solibacter sp.]|nr:hypothetical protein [Candidatus Solibacter sp.]
MNEKASLMAAPVNVALRAFYVLAGIALLVYSLAASSSRMVLYAPAIFGVLLMIQGISGA